MTRTDLQITHEALESARRLALHGVLDSFEFHEIAIDDPFQAESKYREFCEQMLEHLGPPEGMTVTQIGGIE